MGVIVWVGVDVAVGVTVRLAVKVLVMLAVCVGVAVGRGARAEQAARQTRRNEKKGTKNMERNLFIVEERGNLPKDIRKGTPARRASSLLSRYLFLAHSLFSPLINASVFSRQMLSLNCLGVVLKK